MTASNDQFRLIIDSLPIIAWRAQTDGAIEILNQRWHLYTGLSQEEARGWGWAATIHTDDRTNLTHAWRAIIESRLPGETEARVRRADGKYRWFLLRAEPQHDATGDVVGWYGAMTDIEDRKQSDFILNAEQQTLEMIASGAELADVLLRLCNTIDAQVADAKCAICVMDPDGQRLWPAVYPRLPIPFMDAMTPILIGPSAGSCGAAAYSKKRVISGDIATDPIWAICRQSALDWRLRAVWSEPIVSTNGEVVGVFSMWYSESRSPDRRELQLIEGAAQVARIAIQNDQSQATLNRTYQEIKQSEARLRKIIDTIPTLVWCSSPDGTGEFWNQRWHDYTGLSPEAVRGWGWEEAIYPEDRERITEKWRGFLASGQGGEVEGRLRRFDGEYRWFLFRAEPLRDESGKIVNWYGTDTDIQDRKQAEERIRNENLALREEIDRSSMFEEIIGSCEPMRRVLSQVMKVARTDSTVLILGETGTGKELIARAIHGQSNRSDHPFVRVNCAAIPQSLIASELFGHEKGAFTGATHQRLGRFESAEGGTIFLDEVAELPMETQALFLRVLQEREFERVGSSKSIQINVRVLAATNRNLRAAVAAGTFREDLFYRLHVFPVDLPPLRDRLDDIPQLVEYLIDLYGKKIGRKIRSVQRKTMALIQAYDWPGNIRELQNVIERAVILCDGDTLIVDETWLKRESRLPLDSVASFATTLAQTERELIVVALKACGGRTGGPNGAAAKLGLPRQTLESKLRTLDIDKSLYREN